MGVHMVGYIGSMFQKIMGGEKVKIQMLKNGKFPFLPWLKTIFKIKKRFV